MKQLFSIKIILLSFQKERLSKTVSILHYLLLKFQYIYNLNNNIVIKGPISIPQKKYKLCVIKAPFVYKKSQELYEIITYKQIFLINILQKDNVFALKLLKLLKIIVKQICYKMPPGINIKIKTKFNA